MNLLPGGDIDAPRGLIEDQHLRLRQRAPPQQHLLLIASRKLPHGLLDRPSANPQPVAHRRRFAPLASPRNESPHQPPPQGGNPQVVADRQGGKDPLSQPIFRQVGEPRPHRVGRRPGRIVHAVDRQRASRERTQPHQGLGPFTPPSANQSIHPQDLAAVHAERDLAKAPTGIVQPGPAKDLVGQPRTCDARGQLGFAPDHAGDQFVPGERPGGPRPDNAAVAQDGHACCEPFDLFQPVRDVNDASPAPLPLGQLLEQPVTFAGREGTGGLIEQEDPGIERQGGGQLNQLPLGD